MDQLFPYPFACRFAQVIEELTKRPLRRRGDDVLDSSSRKPIECDLDSRGHLRFDQSERVSGAHLGLFNLLGSSETRRGFGKAAHLDAHLSVEGCQSTLPDKPRAIHLCAGSLSFLDRSLQWFEVLENSRGSIVVSTGDEMKNDPIAQLKIAPERFDDLVDIGHQSGMRAFVLSTILS
jgi:hypothetical protein